MIHRKIILFISLKRVIINRFSFGDFLRFNPHFHSLILEGGRRFSELPVLRLHLDILSNGFDEDGDFIHIPILDLSEMKECFRRLIVNHFKDTGLIPKKMARNLLSWKHSGFNINNSIRIMGNENKAREALAQYIAQCPISLDKIINEPMSEKVIFKTEYNAYFKENVKIYDPVLFIDLVAQHIPVSRVRLIRYFGLYSSKSRGKWHDWEHVVKHAPDGWKEQYGLESQNDDAEMRESAA